MVQPFTAPEDALDFIHDLLEERAGEIGLNTVAYGDENLLGTYPAVKVVPGLMAKILHGTHTWQNEFTVDVWVYHAKMTQSHAQRSREDLLLVSSVREVLHEDMTCDGGVIQGWVNTEMPVLVNRKGGSVVGTRMVWNGIQQERFK